MALADPDPFARAGMRRSLEASGVEICGEAETGQDAIGLAQSVRPDVVLISEWFPNSMSGVEAAGEIRLMRIPVVILALPNQDHDVVLGARMGVNGYVTKDPDMDLARQCELAAAGHRTISPELAEELLLDLRPDSSGRSRELTSRELEVLRLIQSGMSNAEIADRLLVSLATVKTHVHSLLAKTKSASRLQLAIRASSDRATK